MPETAVNLPFESSEIIDIAMQEFRKRLLGLSPLQSNKEYAGFSLDFQVKIHLRRTGEAIHEGRETLAWGNVQRGELPSGADLDAVSHEMEIADHTSTFESKDPNDERIERDMPLVVEASDGKGGKIRKKVRVSNAGKKAAKGA